jgi:hypothetical protein
MTTTRSRRPTHGARDDVDVEDVPASRIPMLRVLAESAGFTTFVDEGNHYHLRRL